VKVIHYFFQCEGSCGGCIPFPQQFFLVHKPVIPKTKPSSTSLLNISTTSPKLWRPGHEWRGTKIFFKICLHLSSREPRGSAARIFSCWKSLVVAPASPLQRPPRSLVRLASTSILYSISLHLLLFTLSLAPSVLLTNFLACSKYSPIIDFIIYCYHPL